MSLSLPAMCNSYARHCFTSESYAFPCKALLTHWFSLLCIFILRSHLRRNNLQHPSRVLKTLVICNAQWDLQRRKQEILFVSFTWCSHGFMFEILSSESCFLRSSYIVTNIPHKWLHTTGVPVVFCIGQQYFWRPKRKFLFCRSKEDWSFPSYLRSNLCMFGGILLLFLRRTCTSTLWIAFSPIHSLSF